MTEIASGAKQRMHREGKQTSFHKIVNTRQCRAIHAERNELLLRHGLLPPDHRPQPSIIKGIIRPANMRNTQSLPIDRIRARPLGQIEYKALPSSLLVICLGEDSDCFVLGYHPELIFNAVQA